MMKNRKNSGITLIALVITIIVLLILAGVSIATLTGENGILTQATTAKEVTQKATAKEKVEIEVLGSYDNSGKLNMNLLKENLKKNLGLTDADIISNSDGSLTLKVDGYEILISVEGEVSLVNPPKDKSGANDPVLKTGMTAVYWDENGKEVETTGDNNTWYQYVAGDNSTDSKDSKWANAKTSDGSYWVWIPRYEYKILSGEGTSTTGKIEVKFIPRTQTTADEGYKIHPAFINGKSNLFKNGEWDSELAGIWVAKYEMSMETDKSHTETSSIEIGNVLTSDSVKVVSKPGVTSWRYITIGNMYTNAYNYDRSKESHLMKNSEWGAVAYLTHSQYGRNGNEITINSNSSYYTGGGEGEAYKTNVAQSTTGNLYGIYDLSGGAWERTAAYITNGNSNLTYGDSFVATTTADAEAYKTQSTKYATVYPYDSSSDGNANNYTAYKNAGYGYGDATVETSASGSGSTSWNGDYSYFPSTGVPFFLRGGCYNNGSGAGVFYFNVSNGLAYISFSFRAVLAGV